MSAQGREPLTDAQRAVLKTFLAVMDRGHFSPESQEAAGKLMEIIKSETREKTE